MYLLRKPRNQCVDQRNHPVHRLAFMVAHVIGVEVVVGVAIVAQASYDKSVSGQHLTAIDVAANEHPRLRIMRWW